MKKYILFITIISLCLSTAASAQLKIPDYRKFDKSTNYAAYEKDILNCITFLENTPLQKDRDSLTTEANMFLLAWLSGSPKVVITLSSYTTKICATDNQLLAIFLGGAARYQILSKDTSEIPTQVAAIQAIIKYYKGDNGAAPNDFIDSLVEINKQDQLATWLRKKS